MPRVLSIQSWVAFGHVGNAVAVFALQRLGLEVSAIQTVQFSNHTGYGAWTGTVFPSEQITQLMQGLADRHTLKGVDVLLSGYMGSSGTVAAVQDAVARVRAANPLALYACDPVIGDVGRGVFVHPEIPAQLLAALPNVDLLTPNQFELELLSGIEVVSLETAIGAARVLQNQMRATGPRIVLVTSLMRPSASTQIETLAVTPNEAWLLSTPLLPLEPPRNGTGDLIAALFVGQLLKLGSVQRALELAVSSLYGVLETTHIAGSRELCLVQAQEELVQPTKVFVAEQVKL